MRKTARVAVIGAGNMGRNHIRVVAEIAHLVGISDTVAETGKVFTQQYSVPFFTSATELLDTQKPDAVIIATPTPTHAQIATECLNRRIPTLVEKPITPDVASARKLLRLSKEKKTLLMVGHIERFNPAVRSLYQLIKSGRLGRIVSLLAIRVGIRPPPHPNSDVLLDLGIHDVDIFNWLLDEYPTEKNIIRRQLLPTNRSDSAFAMLKYKQATAVVQTNWITPTKIRNLYVGGTLGYAEVDYINQKLAIYEKIAKFRAGSDFLESSLNFESPKKEIFISKKEPLKEEIKFFLSALKTPRLSNALSSLEALIIVL